MEMKRIQKVSFKEIKPSIEITHPELAKEWHPEKNKKLNIDDFTSGSDKKVWWVCEKYHEWKARISSRAGGSRCPYCSGRLPIVGETDLATVNPELAAEWHPTKNGELTPQDVRPRSGKKVWWQCSEGHEWHATIHNRSAGRGCPICAKINASAIAKAREQRKKLKS